MESSNDEIAIRLAAQHREFLAFLRKRVESDELAEDILQSAMAKALEKSSDVDEESVIAWFYRVLRNALVDHYRRRAAESKALEREARSAPPEFELPEVEQELCACMGGVIDSLKPEYADMLRAVDLAGESAGQYAHANGVTANNAAVRLHRARRALKRQLELICGSCTEHGCLDCSCRSGSGRAAR